MLLVPVLRMLTWSLAVEAAVKLAVPGARGRRSWAGLVPHPPGQQGLAEGEGGFLPRLEPSSEQVGLVLQGQLKPLFTPQRCLTPLKGSMASACPTSAKPPRCFPGRAPGAGPGRKGKGGTQKAQKHFAHLNTWLGAFHYTMAANLVKIIQNI